MDATKLLRRWITATALGCVVLGGSAAAEAQWLTATSSSTVQGALYEVTEDMYLLDASGMPTADVTAAVRRVADATLSGWAALGTPLCPSQILWIVPTATKCTINAKGMDDLDIKPDSPTLWKGGVQGTYTVVVQDDNPIDAAEFVIETGSFQGSMDLAARPLGTVTGIFKPCAPDASCTGAAFKGRFRLPFKIVDGRKVTPKRWEPAYYLKDDGVNVSYVQAGEYSLGYAAVKIELTFPTQ